MSRSPVALLTMAVALATSGSTAAAPGIAGHWYDPSDVPAWYGSGTEDISYYNYCTGWVYFWEFVPGDGDQVGTRFDSLPGASRTLNESWIWVHQTVPSGYGFTGTISVESNPDCPGATLASQPWLPASTRSWHLTSWGGVDVPDPFLLLLTMRSPSWAGALVQIGTDHPGPAYGTSTDWPPACGTCFPTTRVSRTLYYGVDGSLCPGVPLTDGTCDVELLVGVSLTATVDVEADSWAHIKAMYR